MCVFDIYSAVSLLSTCLERARRDLATCVEWVGGGGRVFKQQSLVSGLRYNYLLSLECGTMQRSFCVDTFVNSLLELVNSTDYTYGQLNK